MVAFAEEDEAVSLFAYDASDQPLCVLLKKTTGGEALIHCYCVDNDQLASAIIQDISRLISAASTK